MPSVLELIPILQTAIGPVILISGVGLLLLTMTNRLGRAIDRARLVAGQLAREPEAARESLAGQLVVLWRRARLIRAAIVLAAISALFAALLIILLFFVALLGTELGWLVVALFILCLVALIAALILFIHDLNQSLTALRIEIEKDMGRTGSRVRTVGVDPERGGNAGSPPPVSGPPKR